MEIPMDERKQVKKKLWSKYSAEYILIREKMEKLQFRLGTLPPGCKERSGYEQRCKVMVKQLKMIQDMIEGLEVDCLVPEKSKTAWKMFGKDTQQEKVEEVKEY